MALLLCSDGIELEWPHSSGGITTARGQLLRDYLSRDISAADRALVASQLRPIQIEDLFDGEMAKVRAKKLALIGRRITQSGTYQFARHLGEDRLKKVFIRRGFNALPRAEIIGLIMAYA